MFFFALIVAALIGYVVSIHSWTQVHAWLVGVETAVRSLEDKIKALKAK